MDIPQLQALISRSTLLTNDERTYWLATLPAMQTAQIAKLVEILTEAEKVPLKESVHEYFQAIGTPAAPSPIAA